MKNEPTELFLSLLQPQQVAIRQKLLQCLGNEALPHVRNRVGDAVAEIARQYSEEGAYHLPFISHRQRFRRPGKTPD